MFKKILVANRGEIAVRIIRACHDMGINAVALYSKTDRDSLHVRMADEAIPITSDLSYGDKNEVLEIAMRTGADAIHPGYGFLAEESDFAQMCVDAGIVFVGPPPDVIAALRNKLNAMKEVRRLGIETPVHSDISYDGSEPEALAVAAGGLGFPTVIKLCHGRGGFVAMHADQLAVALGLARREARTIYGDSRFYLERAVSPSHYITVQILADIHGNMVHLGEHEGSLIRRNQKLVEESPAPCLPQALRERIWQAAITVARAFGYQGLGTVKFLVDDQGRFYFTEIEGRTPIGHPVTEMVTGIDLVAEQIRIAAGEPLSYTQNDVRLQGHAMQCRINAEDPWQDYLPSPGNLERFRLPGGPHVRVDTYGYAGCQIPLRYDSLLAKIVTWAQTREACLRRLTRALEDFKIVGVQTNLPLHQHILRDPAFAAGKYDTAFMRQYKISAPTLTDEQRCDLAAALGVAYLLRNELSQKATPTRLSSGWHRSARILPE